MLFDMFNIFDIVDGYGALIYFLQLSSANFFSKNLELFINRGILFQVFAIFVY